MRSYDCVVVIEVMVGWLGEGSNFILFTWYWVGRGVICYIAYLVLGWGCMNILYCLTGIG